MVTDDPNVIILTSMLYFSLASPLSSMSGTQGATKANKQQRMPDNIIMKFLQKSKINCNLTGLAEALSILVNLAKATESPAHTLK